MPTFTGRVTGITQDRPNGPLKVTANDGGQFDKTFRVWKHEYNEDANAPKVQTQNFSTLENAWARAVQVSITYDEREYQAGGQTRKSNDVTDVSLASEVDGAGVGPAVPATEQDMRHMSNVPKEATPLSILDYIQSQLSAVMVETDKLAMALGRGGGANNTVGAESTSAAPSPDQSGNWSTPVGSPHEGSI